MQRLETVSSQFTQQLQTLKTVQDAYEMKSELKDNKKKVYDELKNGNSGALQFLPNNLNICLQLLYLKQERQ